MKRFEMKDLAVVALLAVALLADRVLFEWKSLSEGIRTSWQDK